jgi:tripartite-type tricarboxylate transporter receptor subunit TctC
MFALIRTSLALILAGAMFAAGPVAAQPAKPVHIIVAFTAGGPVDFVARVLSEQLGRELGQTVIVENKPGANGAIGGEFVAKSAPDGGTLWLTSVGAVAINPALYDKLPYDPQRDFAPVSVVVNNVEVLVVNPANPAKDAAAFVAATKQKQEPTPIASSGMGSIPHLALELMADASKANVLHVPYKGAAPAITDVIGGQVAGFFGDVPGLMGHIKGGKLKPIGIAAPKRHPLLPEVKTFAELGIPGVDSDNWYALFAAAKTPAAEIERLNRAVRRALASDSVRTKLLNAGSDPAPSTPDELSALLARDTAKWARIIREKKVKAE